MQVSQDGRSQNNRGRALLVKSCLLTLPEVGLCSSLYRAPIPDCISAYVAVFPAFCKLQRGRRCFHANLTRAVKLPRTEARFNVSSKSLQKYTHQSSGLVANLVFSSGGWHIDRIQLHPTPVTRSSKPLSLLTIQLALACRGKYACTGCRTVLPDRTFQSRYCCAGAGFTGHRSW